MSKIYAAVGRELVVIDPDDGYSTERRLEGLDPQCITVDPSDADRVYAGTFDDGLFRSDDGGDSWTAAGDEITEDRIMAVSVHPSKASGDHHEVWVGTEPSAVYRSDGGDRFELSSDFTKLASRPDWFYPVRPEAHYVRGIEIDPNDPDQLYVVVESGAIPKSSDGGETWQDRIPGSPLDTHTLAVHPDAPDRLYSAAGDGFIRSGFGYWESFDRGQTWERPTEGMQHHYLWSIAVDPGDPDTMVVSAAQTPTEMHSPMVADTCIYRRSNGAWERSTEGLPESEGTVGPIIKTRPDKPGVFYLLSNRGLYRSADRARSWERLNIPWEDHFRFAPPGALAV